MNPAAIEQARVRLNKAKRAVERLAGAQGFPEAEDAWTDFLLAASAIYSKLEQGAKSSGKSHAWFGRKKKERKDDPLLRYIHHARNSDEHGIERVTERRGRSWDFSETPVVSGAENFGKTHRIKVQKVDRTTLQPIGNEVQGILHGPTIWLIPVTDTRYHDTFDPPKEHLGESIPFPVPLEVAQHAIRYLETFVEEAASLA